ncbi:hypothetical protein AOZ07_04990 [Glutamicibacter halophytocola]|nr:hypothetical protein AOZ07_04990 [Glutamicibacter halophytocola]
MADLLGASNALEGMAPTSNRLNTAQVDSTERLILTGIFLIAPLRTVEVAGACLATNFAQEHCGAALQVQC